jgi:DUF4097 and DUF4098 domain-containing protein YvlB
MTTRHTVTSLLLVASLALAGPALAQSDPCPPLSKPGKVARPGDVSPLGRLAQGGKAADLANLARLADLADLADLSELNGLRDLPQMLGLGQVRDLARLRAHAYGQAGQSVRRTRRGGPEQTERFTKTFRVGRTGSLYLSSISGDITIKPGPGDDILVDAIKRTPQGADAQRQLSVVTIDAVQQASRVEVRTRYPERSGTNRTSVDYHVTVPAGTSLDIHSVSGDVQVTGIKGSLRTDCISGDVHIEDADQIEQVKVVSGDVTVVGGAGTDVRVESISGELTLRNVKARSLDVSTVSGGVTLTDVTGDRACVKTMSGDVEYVGPFTHGGHYEFTAHSGDVRLTPTSNTGFEVDATSFSGNVRSDIPITLKPGEVQPRRGRREMKGTFGDGSALVTVHTFNGDVTITKK